MAHASMSDDDIAALLALDANKPKRGGPRKDPTEVRTAATWFKLHHNLVDHVCANPDCPDPRTTVNECSLSGKFHAADCNQQCEQVEDKGRKTTVEIKGHWICRYCFLAGFLK